MRLEQPIQEESQDFLGRRKFAHELANLILKWPDNESVAFGVFGAWGSGKTSILNLAVSNVKKRTKGYADEHRPLIIHFNPWLFSETGELLRAFFDQFTAVLAKERPSLPRSLSKLLKQYENQVTIGTAATASALSILATASSPTNPLLAVGLTGLSAGLNELNRHFHRSDRSIEDLRSQINRQIQTGLAGKIIVVIDDIDRLTEQEVCTVVKLIRLIADFPRTVYLVAGDREVIAAALNSVSGGKGHQYLEKIIQFPVDLPVLERAKLREYLTKGLNGITELNKLDDNDLRRWVPILQRGILPLVQSIRSAIRLLNQLEHKAKLHSGEVNPVDLIAIETISLFTPEVFNRIARAKSWFTSGVEREPVYELDRMILRPDKDAVGSILKTIEAGCHTDQWGPVRFLLSELFPVVAWATGPDNLDFRPTEPIYRSRRLICSRDMFDYYFLLHVPTGDISQAEIEDLTSALLTDEQHAEDRINSIIKSQRLPRLLELLAEGIIGRLTSEASYLLAMILAKLDSELDNPADNGIFSLNPRQLCWLCIDQCIQQQNRPERKFATIDALLDDASDLSLPINIIDQIHHRSDSSQDEPSLEENQLRQLDNKATAMLRKLSEDCQIFRQRNRRILLEYWIEHDVEGTEDFIRNCVHSFETALELVQIFSTRSIGHGSRPEKYHWTLNEITNYIEFGQLDAYLGSPEDSRIAALSDEKRQLYEDWQEFRSHTAQGNVNESRPSPSAP